MPAGIRIIYDDEWILAHVNGYTSWKKLCAEYNKSHSTEISHNTFKSHCNRELNLDNHYTEEQNEWLREYYYKFGNVEIATEFQKRFGECRTAYALVMYCKRKGLKVSEERRKIRAIENTGRYHEIGTVRKLQNGEPYIKTEHGWKRVKNLVYGDVPKGYKIIHLDQNVDNCEKENLCAISNKVAARMTAHRLWSKNAVITKTATMVCELEDLVGSEVTACVCDM